MSKRPKKQISKATSSLLEQLTRQRGIRDLHKRFLIVCEDSKSAPDYFNQLKKYENLSATSIAVLGSNGKTQPIQVVELAIDRKCSSEQEESATEPFDHVWCVIDGDYGAKIANARSKAAANGVSLAVSTTCFEYWVLLHFEEYGAPFDDCAGIVRYLKHKHWADYTKGACQFSQILPHVRDASSRASKLRRRGVLPEEQNPCSDIYLLIDEILGALPIAPPILSSTRRRSKI